MPNVMKKLLGRKKNAEQLVASTKRAIKILKDESKDPNKESTAKQKALEKISNNLLSMKHMLYEHDGETPNEENQKRLGDELRNTDLLFQLLLHMKLFKFEARKDAALIYNFVLRNQEETVTYLLDNEKKKDTVDDDGNQMGGALTILIRGYEDQDMALNCGSILREATRRVEINMYILNDPSLFHRFFEYVELSTFDVASDAFQSFRFLLARGTKEHSKAVAKFLETHHNEVFEKFNKLLTSENYVTKRQSLKLLGEILLNRDNFTVMMRYIADVENLKILMNLLRVTHKAIQFEAFHVFKIFVANPKKSKQVLEILLRNKEKLKKFLEKFQNEKDDESFTDEKKILLKTLNNLNESMLEKAQPYPPQQQQQATAASEPAKPSTSSSSS
jgi:calcium binding protein 39